MSLSKRDVNSASKDSKGKPKQKKNTTLNVPIYLLLCIYDKWTVLLILDS